MSDIRFIIVGIVLIFSGFLILGIFGGNYQSPNIETREFKNCFDYSEDKEPVLVDCSSKIMEQNLFFVFVLALILGGIIALLKGVKGDWDSRVKPEDMVGPSRDSRTDGNDS
jgi:hypothetical protein